MMMMMMMMMMMCKINEKASQKQIQKFPNSVKHNRRKLALHPGQLKVTCFLSTSKIKQLKIGIINETNLIGGEVNRDGRCYFV
jgi:hypothetical protein